MAELRREQNDTFKEFYTGTVGRKTVNCILDDNCVRYIVFDGLKMKSRREFSNTKKDMCFKNATRALNK